MWQCSQDQPGDRRYDELDDVNVCSPCFQTACVARVLSGGIGCVTSGTGMQLELLVLVGFGEGGRGAGNKIKRDRVSASTPRHGVISTICMG